EDLDEEMAEMTRLEVDDLKEKIQSYEEELKVLLLPKYPNDERNVIMEIRAAAGGDEAALFAGDLYRMYSRYAEAHNRRIEIIEAATTGVGSYNYIIFMVHGKGVFSRLKFDNRAHRV